MPTTTLTWTMTLHAVHEHPAGPGVPDEIVGTAFFDTSEHLAMIATDISAPGLAFRLAARVAI